jgi:hypothetical protein
MASPERWKLELLPLTSKARDARDKKESSGGLQLSIPSDRKVFAKQVLPSCVIAPSVCTVRRVARIVIIQGFLPSFFFDSGTKIF